MTCNCKQSHYPEEFSASVLKNNAILFSFFFCQKMFCMVVLPYCVAQNIFYIPVWWLYWIWKRESCLFSPLFFHVQLFTRSVMHYLWNQRVMLFWFQSVSDAMPQCSMPWPFTFSFCFHVVARKKRNVNVTENIHEFIDINVKIRNVNVFTSHP